MQKTSTRKTLLRTTERINASCLEDLAKYLRVSRQAVQQRALYHNAYDELKVIFKENQSAISLLPKKPGIVIFQREDEKIYLYSKVNIRMIAKAHCHKFEGYKLSHIVVTKSNVILECLKRRFKDLDSRLLCEKESGKFPYIHSRKNKRYYIYTPQSQTYLGYASTFESAVNILKLYVFKKKIEKKKTFIEGTSRDELYKLYVEKKLKFEEIAKKMHTSSSTIYLSLRKLNIPINNVGRPRND
jgi:hypothetical protein